MARSNKVGIIVGRRNAGKTDWTKNNIVRKSPFQKKLIVDTFDSAVWHNLKTYSFPDGAGIPVSLMDVEDLSRWQTGIYRVFSSDTDHMLSQVERFCRNCVIVLEDATKYVGSKLTKPMRKFILDSKQKNLDVWLVFHSLSQVPPDLIKCADILVLFKTNDQVVSKTKYPPEVAQLFEKVKASSDPYYNDAVLIN